MEIKHSLFFIIILGLTLFSCSPNPFIVDFQKIENNKQITITDLSKIITFESKTNNVIVLDSFYLDTVIKYLIQNKTKHSLIIQCSHSDRLHLDVLQNQIGNLKDYFIKKGISSSLVSSRIGLDFGTKYSIKLEKALILLILDDN